MFILDRAVAEARRAVRIGAIADYSAKYQRKRIPKGRSYSAALETTLNQWVPGSSPGSPTTQSSETRN